LEPYPWGHYSGGVSDFTAGAPVAETRKPAARAGHAAGRRKAVGGGQPIQGRCHRQRLLVAVDGLLEDALGLLLVAPTGPLDLLAGLEVLVVHEEVLDLVQGELGDVADV